MVKIINLKVDIDTMPLVVFIVLVLCTVHVVTIEQSRKHERNDRHAPESENGAPPRMGAGKTL